MDYKKLLQIILDIAEEMLVAGAEVSRVEDSIERMCIAYGCDGDRVNAFIITSNIQVTLEAPDGEIITQIRRVLRSDANYDRLDYLNDLSRRICAEPPDLDDLRTAYDEVMARPKHGKTVDILGHFLIAGGFAVFFGGNILDGLASGLIGILVWALGRLLAKNEDNLLARTFALSIISGFAAIPFAILGLHVDKIIIGVIMLLIPGIAITNSIRDMLIGDIATGLLRFFNSVLVAIAIACGFSLSLLIMGSQFTVPHGVGSVSFLDRYPEMVQITAAFIGSIGFTLYFNMRGKQIWYAAAAAAMTWGIYIWAALGIDGDFIPNLIAAIFVGVVADILARVNRTPQTIFLTASAVPLIPGASLYYAMAGLVTKTENEFSYYGQKCVIIALAIALGFMVVAIIQKYTRKTVK